MTAAHGPRCLALAVGAALALAAGVAAWCWPTGQERATLRGHGGPVWAVAFAPDGAALATAGQDGSTRRWGAAGRGQDRRPRHPRAARAPAGSPARFRLAPPR